MIFLQNVIVHAFFTIEHIGEVFLPFCQIHGICWEVGQPCSSQGVKGPLAQVLDQRSATAVLFCHSRVSSASAALVLHQWFLTFSAVLLVLLHKVLYRHFSSERLGLVSLALHRPIYSSTG